MDNKKELERAELHRTIWKIANDLRGSVDGWDFKQYVLGMLFYRYISENLVEHIHRHMPPGFTYPQMSDEQAEELREELVNEKGFFILPSELFENVRARAAQDASLNETLVKVFQRIEASSQGCSSEANLRGLFDDLDVNSKKLGENVRNRNDKLVKLMDGVASMQLGDYQDNSIDAFGDAYEYLMSMYASNAGKSGGEFFTPQEVSELLVRIAAHGRTDINKIYDPACGSGSLLLKAAKVLGKEHVRGFYGQEINITTYNLCRINMFLHDIDFNKFDIRIGDTLVSPQHQDREPFEVIVSNPPYSIRWEGDGRASLLQDERFMCAGVLAPKNKADLAFVMHSLSCLDDRGTASIVCFPGVMYRGGNEQKIRKYLVENNCIDCIIQLPEKLFFGTSIPTCIMVLRKSKPDDTILFIDATGECTAVSNGNKLTQQNIDNIVEAYAARQDRAHFSRLVPGKEVKAQRYNLSVATYVELALVQETIDIRQLNEEIAGIVAREQALRDEIDRIIADLEGASSKR